MIPTPAVTAPPLQAEIAAEGNAARLAPEISVGDELIATSGMVYTTEQEYQGNRVRGGEWLLGHAGHLQGDRLPQAVQGARMYYDSRQCSRPSTAGTTRNSRVTFGLLPQARRTCG